MATILSQRSSNLSTFNGIAINYSTLTGSTIITNSLITTISNTNSTITTRAITVSSLTLNSTMVSLGQSTNQTYTTLAQGAISTVGNWATSLASLVSTKTVSMSANAQYQLAITQVSTATSVQYTSTLGTTWSAISGASGLPTPTVTNYSAGAVSASGKYQLITSNVGYPYLSNNYGSTWTNVNTSGTAPNYYFPFDNSLTDVQGATTLTSTGTVGYTTGPTGTGALSLSNTVSGVPNNYVRGPISLGSNFILTCFFNFVTLPSVDGTYSMAISLGSSTANSINISYYYGAQYTGFYVGFKDSQNIAASILGAYAITTNTWYSLKFIYQSDSTSYVYINNVPVASLATSTRFNQITQITIGGDNPILTTGAFNGYIDELRIWNTSNILLPPLYTSFERDLTNNSYDDSGQTKLSVTGTFTYGTGIVGSRSAFFNNTSGNNTSFYYYTMPWPGSANFTVSGWFNATSFSTGGNTPVLFNTYTGACIIQFDTSATTTTTIYAKMPSGAGYVTIGSTTVSTNTWYYFTYIFQSNAICYFYLNNALIGSLINSNGTTGTSNPLTPVVIGSGGATGGTYPFIGYMDDIRVYTSAIPMNYNNASLSASGKYQLATTTYGNLNISNNYGTSWSQVNQSILSAAWQGLAVSATGQYMIANTGITAVTPQQIGLNLSGTIISTTPVPCSWTQNGITWTSICSTNNNSAAFQSWVAFNTLGLSSTSPYSWASNGYYSSGTYNFPYQNNTVISSPGPGTYNGEWLEIRSSVPLVFYSYNFAVGGNSNLPKNFYIVGSNDSGTTWYPIHSVAGGATNPFTANYTQATSNNIIINQSGAQTIASGATGSYNCSIYPPYTTAAYKWFRLAANSVYGGANLELTEWSCIFATSLAQNPTILPLSIVTPQYPSINGTTSGSASTVPIPYSWTYGGITWTANASTVANQYFQPWVAFDTLYGQGGAVRAWASIGSYGGINGLYNGGIYSTTILGGIGAQSGEWLQLQSSIPLVMYSYNFQFGGYPNTPQKYYIVGSTDGTNWYPIQYVTMNQNPCTVNNQITTSGNIIANQSGSQTITVNQTATLTCTTYPTTTNAYTYFRIIATFTFGAPYYNFEIQEWSITFNTPYNSYSTNSGTSWTNTSALYSPSCLAISGTGQYAIGANAQTAYIVSNYLAGFSTNTSTSPTLTSINANIAAAALSNTGQYMVIITAGTTNNVYYSSNYGSTFTGLTLGSTALISCAISYDGSYITVANATTVYTLNNNSNGYSVAIGSQAGASNQMQNAIAIGTQAGLLNQEQSSIAIGAYAGNLYQAANSIVLNASGQALNTALPGFYVAPIATYTTSTASLSLLAYGTDNQIVKTTNAITLLSSGYVGIGTTNPTSVLHVIGTVAGSNKTFDIPHPLSTGKQLVHSLIEGPRCDLIYRGTTVLNNGMATVYIDTQCTYDPQCSMDQGTFAALCTNPQYFLQNMTNYNRVTGTIVGGILTIRCQNTTATDTIGWMVIAERADPFIKQWNRTNANGYLITQYSQ